MPRIVALILVDEENGLFRSSIPKHQMSLNGKRVLDYSLEALSPYCEDVIVVTDRAFKVKRFDRLWEIISQLSSGELCGPDLLLIHDASYPFVMPHTVESLIEAVKRGCRYATAAVPVRESLLFRSKPVPSEKFSLVQYPEIICFSLLREAYEWARSTGREFETNASMLWSWQRITPVIVPGLCLSPNISSPRDLAIFEGALKFADECTEHADKDLSRSRVLVLGGTGGIGSACIDLLREKGAFWYAPTRSELDLKVHCDFHHLASFNAVIHAAGAYGESPDVIMKVNFLSCVDLLLAAESMQWTGNIVFLSSTAATKGRQGIAAYSASKAALNAYIEAEAGRLSRKGIYINAVAPAKVNTRLQRTINPSASPEEMIYPNYIAQVALRYVSTDTFGKIVYIRKGFDI